MEKDLDFVGKPQFTLKKIDEMISTGEIVDGYVMNALYYYKLYLAKKTS